MTLNSSARMDPGVYTLVLRVDRRREVEVGSLGIIQFKEGYYSYTGSARGPGGLRRVERHKEVIRGLNLARRWHIDYLLPYASLEEAVITPASLDLECRIARRIWSELEVVSRFGSTDCRCPGHLHFSQNLDRTLDVVHKAHHDAKMDKQGDGQAQKFRGE